MREWKFGRPKGGKNKVRHKLPCEWCGKAFAAARWDARTCGATCRKKWNNWHWLFMAKHGARPVAGPRGSEELMSCFKPARS